MSIDVFSESAEFKKAVEQAALDMIKRETRACPRYYKAIVTAAPYTDEILGNVCQVRLVGDETVLTLPYSSCADLITVGDLVWVQTTYDSFRNAVVLIKTNMRTESSVPPKHYGAKWDKTLAKMTRLYDAENFPTDTTNFGYFGSVNANYSNPFDDIYPWSEMQLCNIDMNAYLNLSPGDSLTECITAWENDPAFSYQDQYGVWRYRPSFYGKSWDDGTYRYFDVCGSQMDGYIYYPESIVGRWIGREVALSVNGTTKNCLIPSVGLPAGNIAMSTLHTYAKNFGATLDSIYSIDADSILFAVEYANLNSQQAIGNGVSGLCRDSSDLFVENTTSSTVVKVNSADSDLCIPGAQMDIGTLVGGNQIGSFQIVSAATDSQNSNYRLIYLDSPVTVTTSNYWSIHGAGNVADEAIGSRSGYLGSNGKANAYYRGIVQYGNRFVYILGLYKNYTDGHVWIAKNDEEADQYDALNTSVHIDTGIVLANARGYIDDLGIAENSQHFSLPPICTAIGGNGTNPVGDYLYNDTSIFNTVACRGGYAASYNYAGLFCITWLYASSHSNWYYCARPRLKNP